MAQVRVMADDVDEVDAILAELLPWLRACPTLAAGSPTRLGHRGGGGRVVFELMLSGSAAGPVRVEAERTDRPNRSAVGRRRLPPG